jgi:hypothetical protein
MNCPQFPVNDLGPERAGYPRSPPDTMATRSQSRVIELTSLNRMLFWN